MRDVSFINAPLFDEISVKRLYHDVVSQPEMKDYFPDELPKGCQCDREYFYNVWNTLHPETVKEVITYANNQRYAITNKDVQENAIMITEDWQKEIESLPFVSKQKGRMT